MRCLPDRNLLADKISPDCDSSWKSTFQFYLRTTEVFWIQAAIYITQVRPII